MITLLCSQRHVENSTIAERTRASDNFLSVKTKSFINNISFINHSVNNIVTPEINNNNSQDLPDIINEDVTLTPCVMLKNNAKDYVFLGSCKMPLISDMGVTLNQEGKIILIQGNCRNFLSGLYHKNIKKSHYNYYAMSEYSNREKLAFDSLHINAQGELIAKAKDENIHYSIIFNTNTCSYTSEGAIIKLNVTFQKQRVPLSTTLSLPKEEENTVNFDFKNNRLYLNSYCVRDKKYHYNLMDYEIKTLISKKYKISSVKICKNTLQIEAIKKSKVRIFYLDPKYISKSRLIAEKISHKPPQDLYSSFGGDVHEKYDCGQPFSSNRMGNFSTSFIPLFSQVIDNTRTAIIKNKTTKDSIKKYLRGIKSADPGIDAVKSVTKDLLKRTENKSVSREVLAKKIIKDLNNDFMPLLNQLPTYISEEKTFAKKILYLLQNISPDDAIILNKESEFSIFFSMLQNGIPFRSGWFAGTMLSIAKTHRLTLSKSEKDNIKLTFICKKKTSGSLLAGTGQGLESKILYQGNINFFSIMPFEANIILSLYKNKELDFSFELTQSQFTSFIDQTYQPLCQGAISDENRQETHIKYVNEYGTSLSLDMKISELRSGIGIDTTENAQLQLPRIACGTGLNTSLFSFNNKKVANSSSMIQQPSVEKEKVLRLLSASNSIFVGEKFIISPYSFNDDGQIHYRISLIEKGISAKKNTKSFFTFKYHINSLTDINKTIQQQHNRKQVKKTYKMLESIHEQGEIIRPMHKIVHLKMTRNLPKNINLSQKILLGKLSQSTSKKHVKIKNVFSDGKSQQPFISSIYAIANRASSKNRDSFNKKLRHNLVARYNINTNDKNRLLELKEALSALESNKNEQNRSQKKRKFKDLQHQITTFKNNVTYQLNTIDLYSLGEITQTKSSLPNVALNFQQTKTLALKKHLGRISVEYADTTTPTKISGNYNFF